MAFSKFVDEYSLLSAKWPLFGRNFKRVDNTAFLYNTVIMYNNVPTKVTLAEDKQNCIAP